MYIDAQQTSQQNQQQIQLQKQAAYMDLQTLSEIRIQQIKHVIDSEKKGQQQELLNLRRNISSHEQCQSTEAIQDRLEVYQKLQQMAHVQQQICECLKTIDNGACLWKKNQKYSNYYKLYQQTISLLKKVNLIRIVQLLHVTHLLDNIKPSYKSEYVKRYSNIIGDYSISYPQKNKGVPNTIMIRKIFQSEQPILQSILQTLQTIKMVIETKIYLEKIEKLIKNQQKLMILSSKLLTICEVFPYACTLSVQDIVCLPQSHQRRQFLNQFITVLKYGPRQQIKQSFMKVKKSMNIANSFMGVLDNNAAGNKNKFTQILKCLFSKNQAYHESEHMMSKPSLETPKNIWNLTDKKYLKPLVSLGTLPSIEYSQKIYIPRILDQYFQKKGKTALPKALYIQNIKQYYKQLHKQKKYKEAILLRINSPYKLIPKFGKQSKLTQIEKVIVHLHGSGFVGFSTFVHQAYARVWSKNLEVPIISVEYGKAPEYPFPSAILDCLQALVWSIFCFSQVFNANIRKVILVGDSSGGNLALVLNNILLQWQIYKLTGVVCIYPPLNLNIKSFTPSLLSSLNDMILPHTFLKICLKCYLQNPELKPAQDPMLSPILVSQKIIKKYPHIELFIGDIDAFYDDCIRFTQIVNKVEPGKCKLTVFEQFPHGFIMFDMKFNPHQHCEKANRKIQTKIKMLFQIN